MSNKPLKTIRIGKIQAAIWEKEGKFGPMHSVTLESSYEKDGKLENTKSIQARDLPVAEKVLAKAFDFVSEETSQKSN